MHSLLQQASSNNVLLTKFTLFYFLVCKAVNIKLTVDKDALLPATVSRWFKPVSIPKVDRLIATPVHSRLLFSSNCSLKLASFLYFCISLLLSPWVDVAAGCSWFGDWLGGFSVPPGPFPIVSGIPLIVTLSPTCVTGKQRKMRSLNFLDIDSLFLWYTFDSRQNCDVSFATT